jgi:hypothetical protein
MEQLQPSVPRLCSSGSEKHVLIKGFGGEVSQIGQPWRTGVNPQTYSHTDFFENTAGD